MKNSSAPLLKRAPVIGAILIVLGLLAFGALAINLYPGSAMVQEDHTIDLTVHQDVLKEPHGLILFVHLSTFFLGREVVAGLSVLLGIYWLYKRYWREFTMLVVGVGGGSAWWFLLSNLFHRSRPDLPNPIETLNAYSFPSGHTISAVLFYGLMAYLLVPRLHSRSLKALVIIVAVLLMLLVGAGRIYAGDHFPSDVLAGYAFGLAWGGLVYTLVDWGFRIKDEGGRRKDEKQGVGDKGG